MPFKIKFARSRPSKFIKKSSTLLRDEIEGYLNKIANDPRCTNPLRGEFKDLFCYHFNFKGVQYRIVYKIDDENEVIGVIHIGTRENFYKELRHIY